MRESLIAIGMYQYSCHFFLPIRGATAFNGDPWPKLFRGHFVADCLLIRWLVSLARFSSMPVAILTALKVPQHWTEMRWLRGNCSAQ
jgi:hypothetical protein